ncbi:hypothetical protein QWY31_02600 [Cytophagales bacterium LB-30]|uniref:Uncharacterized protein n=1 Tax=Shiella aurantiaca TaxID=3058365 RepID=A0ABT8F1P3_9BACT|nr:hypothetical protein [Shiella aurantiaca]MDN4164371.1 hypothetical protein [Shiella aurantiaca]
MKAKVIIAVLFASLVAASACTQKTCPTYAKQDLKTEKTIRG